jgi:enoyl-CoA hydratase/carnithine racemase
VVQWQGAVQLELAGPVARITLNRPAVLNAMNLVWVRNLETAVTAAAGAADVRVVLVRGAGRAFCAGIDLDMLAREGMPPGFFDGQERAFHLLEEMDKITIAALHGYCLGGGLQLAIACDIRVCRADCGLGLPAVNEGLVPGLAPFRLPRLIGLGPARRLILSGEIIAPDEALRLGLIDYLAPADRFEEEVERIVNLYLRAPRTASVASKHLLRSAFEGDFDAACRQTVPLLAECLASPEIAAAREAWRRRKAGL